jgi:glycosyltransferase involved in cell wall biosynthesis
MTASSPFDVLSVVSTTDRRGAEVFAVDLAAALAAHGARVRTVALSAGTNDDLGVQTLGARRFGPRTLRALRAAARQAEVVVAHGSSTLPACALALRGARVPFVYRNIGVPADWSGSRAQRTRVSASLRTAAAVVALTGAARATLVVDYGVEPERCHIVPTGVDADRFVPPALSERTDARRQLGLPPGAAVVALVGALSAEKEPVLAVDAVTGCPGVHLLVAGEGPMRESAEEHALAVAPGRVHFVGALPDARLAYWAADAVVSTSRTEGLPAVLIEAGLCGVPVVATDVGYVGDVVVDGETGRLCAGGDVAAVTAALREVLERPGGLGPAARRHCRERFALDQVADAWARILRAVVAGPAGPDS